MYRIFPSPGSVGIIWRQTAEEIEEATINGRPKYETKTIFAPVRSRAAPEEVATFNPAWAMSANVVLGAGAP